MQASRDRAFQGDERGSVPAGEPKAKRAPSIGSCMTVPEAAA